MGRASSSKKVARASKAAGRPGTSNSMVWPLSIGAVVLLGIALIAVSAAGRNDSASAGPILGDHWHAAYGINICGEWQPPLRDVVPDTTGIHTHEDGLIHIHPASTQYTRDDATLNAWGEVVGIEISDDTLTLPDQELSEGDDCDGEPGAVQVMAWDGPEDTEGRLIESEPGEYVPRDGEVVTIAFVPEGTELEQPPTVARLQDPTAPEEGRPLVPLEGEGTGTDPSTGEDATTEEDGETETTTDGSAGTGESTDTTATSAP